MARLAEVLAKASEASPVDRISYRDEIAAFGEPAIRAMQTWITTRDLGAFAVRVLEKIAADPAHRREVLSTLRSVSLDGVPTAVARDITDALERLGGGVPTGRGPARPPEPWSGYGSASPLERRFHDAMVDIFRLAGEATRKGGPDGRVMRGYWASYFLRGVRNHGGVAYAHQLLSAEGTTDGFRRLTEEDRLDLTMEALVLRPEYESLFTPGERSVAASRLARAGYQSKLAR
jgi:hypothetical protein